MSVESKQLQARDAGDNEHRLLIAERRHRIVELLNTHGKVTVEALAEIGRAHV